jgi:hypothetical protein
MLLLAANKLFANLPKTTNWHAKVEKKWSVTKFMVQSTALKESEAVRQGDEVIERRRDG